MPNVPQALFGLGLAALAAISQASTPVALVLEVTGGTEPPIDAFDEVSAGVSVDLAVGTRLTFSHYPSCSEVTIEGGSVHFTAQKFLLEKGRVVEEKRVRCPSTIELPKEGRVGGLTMRAPAAKLAPTPRILFLGKEVDALKRVRITHDGTSRFERALTERHFVWPENEAPLEPGKGYVLELVASDSGAIRKLPFEVSTRSRPGSVTIIRLD